MAEMKRFGEAETSRRQQLESALQEATSLFKRELASKDEELADVHAELGCATHINDTLRCLFKESLHMQADYSQAAIVYLRINK